MKRRWKSVGSRQPFVLDGNSKTFKPPSYQPLVDKHLLAFHDQNRVYSKLKNMRVLNKKYQIVDKEIRARILHNPNLSIPWYSNRKLNAKAFRKYTGLNNPQRVWVMGSPSRLTKRHSTLTRQSFIRFIEDVKYKYSFKHDEEI